MPIFLRRKHRPRYSHYRKWFHIPGVAKYFEFARYALVFLDRGQSLRQVAPPKIQFGEDVGTEEYVHGAGERNESYTCYYDQSDWWAGGWRGGKYSTVEEAAAIDYT